MRWIHRKAEGDDTLRSDDSRHFRYRGNPDLRILVGTPQIEQLNVKPGKVPNFPRHEDQLTSGTTEAAR